MSAEQVKRFSDFFDRMDTSGNGELTIAELGNGLRNECHVNKTDEELVEMFMGVDSNKDQKITKDEFINECVHKLPRKEAIKANLNLFFKEKDTDGSGSLDANEVRELLMSFSGGDVTPDVVDQVIAQADTSGDGKVSLAELNTLLSQD